MSKLVFLWLLVTVVLLQHQFTNAAATSSSQTGLRIMAVIDDSPKSPLYLIGNLTRFERLQKLTKITYAKLNYTMWKLLALNGKASIVPNDIRVPLDRTGLFYAVKVPIGSQKYEAKLMLDTGGGLTWTQCEPCTNCFPQRVPIYDPKDSTSFRLLACDDPMCQIFTCVNNQCLYNVKYGDGSITNGVAALETFQFFDGRVSKEYNPILFGCSYDNGRFGFDDSDISGIFGMDLSVVSMASQLTAVSGNKFSYCLVPFHDLVPHPLVLRFGNEVPQLQPGHFQSTPIVSRQQDIYYYVELLDISVGNQRLGFNPQYFRVDANNYGGCFIDSGALFSVMDTRTIDGLNAHTVVMKAFQSYYDSRNLRRKTDGIPDHFELCYEHPHDFSDFLSITYHLNGADYTVDGILGHALVPGTVFCVGILKFDMPYTIIGASHQQNKRIIYDKQARVIQFTDEQCGNDIFN